MGRREHDNNWERTNENAEDGWVVMTKVWRHVRHWSLAFYRRVSTNADSACAPFALEMPEPFAPTSTKSCNPTSSMLSKAYSRRDRAKHAQLR